MDPTTNTFEYSEESGWTMYVDEDLYSGHEQPRSPASDAASSVKKKANEPGQKKEKSCRNQRWKKWKKKGVEEDEALEDTATSPCSSSKVMSKGKQRKAAQLRAQNMEEEGSGERDSELKKNGLCLVPLSFAFNYLGQG